MRKARPVTDPQPPWLLKEVDLYGQETWMVRALFWAVDGPRYFGPFYSRDEAEEFYRQAQDLMGETVCELMNLVSWLKVPSAEDPAPSEHRPGVKAHA